MYSTPIYPPFYPSFYPPFFTPDSILRLNHRHILTTHLFHPIILYPALSFPQHRSILPTINRYIHYSHHHFTPILYARLFLPSASSSCMLGQPTSSIPLFCVQQFRSRATVLFYRHISSSLDAPYPSSF